MKPHKRVFVVGGAHTTFLGRGHPDYLSFKERVPGDRENPSLEDHLGAAVLGALAETGVDPAAIDKGYVSNFLAEAFCSQGHLGAMLAAVHPDLAGKPYARIEAACASGAAAVAACADALQCSADVTLVAGVEVETNVSGRMGVEYMSYAAHFERERDREFALFPWMFARRAKAWKEAFGGTDRDTGRVVVKAYANAKRNPKACQQQHHFSLEQASTASPTNRTFLKDEALHDHIRMADCTDFTDGGSAVILANEDGLKRLGRIPADCTEILGIGHTVRALGAETDPTRLANVADAAAVAYGAAGVGAAEMGLAEVHDCFSITELQLMEALGLCGLGQAGDMLRDGATELTGPVPVNTGGGLLGFGHPIGATGVKQVVEIWRQLTGRCGAYQVQHGPRHAVSANLGGDDRTAVVMIHRAGD